MHWILYVVPATIFDFFLYFRFGFETAFTTTGSGIGSGSSGSSVAFVSGSGLRTGPKLNDSGMQVESNRLFEASKSESTTVEPRFARRFVTFRSEVSLRVVSVTKFILN